MQKIIEITRPGRKYDLSRARSKYFLFCGYAMDNTMVAAIMDFFTGQRSFEGFNGELDIPHCCMKHGPTTGPYNIFNWSIECTRAGCPCATHYPDIGKFVCDYQAIDDYGFSDKYANYRNKLHIDLNLLISCAKNTYRRTMREVGGGDD